MAKGWRLCVCSAWMAILFCAGQASATNVAVVGVFPGKAVLVIDGAAPKTLAIGQETKGVKLLSVEADAATLSIDGKTSRIPFGQPVNLSAKLGGPGADDSVNSITLNQGTGGHFMANGSINGVSARFMVDTGATAVSMSPAMALKAGINYMSGERGTSSTANGIVQIWRVKLDSVTVNGMTVHNVEGAVVQSDMPYVLLGMSFLGRMEMYRDGPTMMLKRRY